MTDLIQTLKQIIDNPSTPPADREAAIASLKRLAETGNDRAKALLQDITAAAKPTVASTPPPLPIAADTPTPTLDRAELEELARKVLGWTPPPPGQLSDEQFFERIRDPRILAQIRRRDGASFNLPSYAGAVPDLRYRLRLEPDLLIIPDPVRRYLFPENYPPYKEQTQ